MSKSTNTTPLAPAALRSLYATGTLKVSDVKDAKGKPVSPASIFGADGTGTKVRGKVHPAFAAHAAAKGHGVMTYGTKVEPTVEVPMFSTKTGRPVKPVVKPLSEVRALAGQPKGRLSAASIAKAAKALGSGEPKVATPKATTKAPAPAAEAAPVSLDKA